MTDYYITSCKIIKSETVYSAAKVNLFHSINSRYIDEINVSIFNVMNVERLIFHFEESRTLLHSVPSNFKRCSYFTIGIRSTYTISYNYTKCTQNYNYTNNSFTLRTNYNNVNLSIKLDTLIICNSYANEHLAPSNVY